jgi:hypothetical protein
MHAKPRTRLVDWLVFLVPVSGLVALSWAAFGRGCVGDTPQAGDVSAPPWQIERTIPHRGGDSE